MFFCSRRFESVALPPRYRRGLHLVAGVAIYNEAVTLRFQAPVHGLAQNGLADAPFEHGVFLGGVTLGSGFESQAEGVPDRREDTPEKSKVGDRRRPVVAGLLTDMGASIERPDLRFWRPRSLGRSRVLRGNRIVGKSIS